MADVANHGTWTELASSRCTGLFTDISREIGKQMWRLAEVHLQG